MRPAFSMSPQLRAALNQDVAKDFPGVVTGSWQTFNVVSASMGSGGSDAPTVTFPVTSALYELEGAASSDGTPDTGSLMIGCTDLFTIQVVYSDQTQLNAGPNQLIGSAFFSRLDGIKRMKKPTVIGPNQVITFNLTNLTSDNLTVYIGVTVLQLELPTNAAQF